MSSWRISEAASKCSLSEDDIRYVAAIIVGHPATEDSVGPESAMICLLYGMIKRAGFAPNEATSMLSRYRERLGELAKSYESAKDGTEVPATCFQVWDNEYAVLTEPGKPEREAFDFRKMVSKKRVRTPALFLGFVLPALFARAFAVRQNSSDQQLEEEGK